MAALRDGLPCARGAGEMQRWPVVAANVRAGSPPRWRRPGARRLTGSPPPIVVSPRTISSARVTLFRSLANDGGPSESRRTARRRERTPRSVLLGAVRQGRDDGGIDCSPPSKSRPGRPGVVVHISGAFPAISAPAPASVCAAALAGRRVALVSMIPVENLDTLGPTPTDLKRADYLVVTIK